MQLSIIRNIIHSGMIRIVEKLLYPFKYDLSYFSLLFAINACISCSIVGIKGSLSFAIILALFYYATTYLLVFFANLSHLAGKMLKPILLLICITLLVMNIYCLYKYKIRAPIHIIASTNINEIRAFIETYFSWPLVVLFFALLLLGSISAYILTTKLKTDPTKHKRAVILALLLIISFITTARNQDRIIEYVDKFGRLSDFADFRYEPTCPKIESSENSRPTYIIIILGESFSPLHSSLYGYEKETNPLLKKRFDDADLIIFNRVASPQTSTSAVFMYLLNTYLLEMEEQKRWYTSTNLIEVMNTAGYHTIWWSNQAETGFCNNLPSGHSKICNEVAFMDENCYDGILLDCKSSYSGKFNAIFYHLLGQHIVFNERYPIEYNIFKPSDYQSSGGGSPEILAQYDNATLYNDFVVNALIEKYKDSDTVVFYLSDHGLDLFDTDPDFFGHAKNTPESQEIGKKIPFMIYLSPLYQQLRPELTTRIREAANNEFCTDKFIYTVMDAAGLKFADNDDVARYSLFNSSDRHEQ